MRARFYHYMLSVAFMLPMTAVHASTTNPLKVNQFKLSNGLTVWLNEDHNQPKVFGAVVVRAGAIDCPGTGIAHYLEHVLFKGTDQMGTLDYKAEKPYLDSISSQYALLSITADRKQRLAIQQNINRLSVEAARYAIPNEFDNLISIYGGTALNAATSYDHTYYHNTFSPQYINQWLQLNSDRLINPVFRLFQGELEAVYEEKNLYADNFLSTAASKGMEQIFKDTPYAQPIIGTTENLKNPDLGKMLDFFNTYYVANNMCLILCGDFQTDSILPSIERTFGRLRSGNVPQRPSFDMPSYKGREVEIKVPVPIIQAEGFLFKAPQTGDADEQAINIAWQMLSNEQRTGLLDSLHNESKMKAVFAGKQNMSGLGIMGFGFIPNIPLGNKKKVARLCWQQIDRIRKGEFSDKLFEACKQNAIRDLDLILENTSSRSDMMIEVFGSQRRTWDDYLNDIQAVRNLRREDIVRVANKYFNDDCLKIDKTMGSYPKDKLTQPDYRPVNSENGSKQSEYARQLAQMPVNRVSPRLLDFNADASHQQLRPLVNLYTVANPYNDIFNLRIRYNIGSYANPAYSQLADYLNELGTDSLSSQQLKTAFHLLGATMAFSCDGESFNVDLTGYDRNLPQVLALVRHFYDHVKGNAQKKEDLIANEKMASKLFEKDNNTVINAMMEKLLFDGRSRYLNRLNEADVKALDPEAMLADFSDIQHNEMTISYSGNKSVDEVAQQLRSYLPLQQVDRSYQDRHRVLRNLQKPAVYLYDMPDSRQNNIITLTSISPVIDPHERAVSRVFSSYFGEGQSSVLFQEVREFRSMAYSTHGRLQMPSSRYASDPCVLYTVTGTQADKTLSALSVIESLMKTLPMRENMVKAAQGNAIADINNEYPAFRKIPTEIGSFLLRGYTSDPQRQLAEQLPTVKQSELESFFRNRIKDHPYAIIIVGSKKSLDMKALRKYGPVIELKKADIYR